MAAKKSAKKDAPAEVVTAFKGFDKNMQCRGYQFEVGKTFTHDGEVKACEGGFHACEYPLDVFNYYAPSDSRFARVDQIGDISRHDEDSKVASRSISIKEEISIPSLITAAFEFINTRCEPASSEHATGYSSASSATGYCSASSATGNSSASSATGYCSASSATGNSSASVATGNSSASVATGNGSASVDTGYSSASVATGDGSASVATGYSSASSATGHRSASVATGNGSASSATGHWSASVATGYSSASVATGHRSASVATGHWSASVATGDGSASLANGWSSTSEITPSPEDKPLHAVAAAFCGEGRARAPKGSAIVLCHRNNDGCLIHIRASKVGDNGIKPNVWYSLDKNCEFVEVN